MKSVLRTTLKIGAIAISSFVVGVITFDLGTMILFALICYLGFVQER